jgi:hypothetical protein
VLIATFAYVAFLKTIYAAIEHYSKPDRELSRDDLQAILQSINVVVGDKAKRFVGHAKVSLTSHNLPQDRVFQEITKPEQQIGLLVSALQGVLGFLDKDTLFRVGLLIIQDGKPVEWAHFEPAERPPRTQATELDHPGSTVMQCIGKKSTVLVEDIQKELRIRNKEKRRYLQLNTRSNENGSQLCYPIAHSATGKIEYVITVAGDRRCCLIEKHLPLYEWIIDHFALRIRLEHSLMILKREVQDERKKYN